MRTHRPAPELQVSQWLNTATPITLESLRGRITLMYAFQMLCPSCISHGLPQAAKARAMFAERDLQVIGLHTVFEHHDAMSPHALQAFVHEYKLTFPIGVDQPSANHHIPLTMRAYQLQGTPSLVLIDRAGALRAKHFGPIDDMALGAMIGQLVGEGRGLAQSLNDMAPTAEDGAGLACGEHGCTP